MHSRILATHSVPFLSPFVLQSPNPPPPPPLQSSSVSVPPGAAHFLSSATMAARAGMTREQLLQEYRRALLAHRELETTCVRGGTRVGDVAPGREARRRLPCANGARARQRGRPSSRTPAPSGRPFRPLCLNHCCSSCPCTRLRGSAASRRSGRSWRRSSATTRRRKTTSRHCRCARPSRSRRGPPRGHPHSLALNAFLVPRAWSLSVLFGAAVGRADDRGGAQAARRGAVYRQGLERPALGGRLPPQGP